MLIRRLTAVALALLAPALHAQRQTRTVEKIADGVYAVIRSEAKSDPVESNSLIIIGDDGVCVVDGHYTPSAAREDIATIKSLTKLPVKYLVTTHWHDDHIFGNQEYVKAYPGVSIIAQNETRGAMIRHGVEHQQMLIDHYDKAVPRVEHLLATGRNSKGDTVPADAMAFWKVELPVYRDFVAELKTMKVVLPTVTFDSSLTLFLGQREIRVLHLMGNTKGDATIWLPKERIADIGDLVVYPVPYIYGGYPATWGKALQSVKALDPAIIVLGHGPVQRDLTYFGQVSALMDAMATQVGDAVKRGLSIEDTRKAVDFSALHDQIVQGDEVREGTWQSSIMQSGVESAWKDAKGEDQGD